MTIVSKMKVQALIVWVVSTTLLGISLDMSGWAFLGLLVSLLGVMMAFKRFTDAITIQVWLDEWEKANGKQNDRLE